jgi:peptidoglycan-N-acetylglucosamine deacetylase
MDVALTFDFDAEEVWISTDPANAARPGVLSQGAYDARVAVPLLLDLLARHGVRATFFVPGKVAERYPDRVREILAGGHEVGLHGYTHTSPAALSEAEEEAELVRSRAVLEALGAQITGYRSPSWDFSPATLELLRRHGIAYSSNMMDDIKPYRHPSSGLVELPVQWLLDDAPHFWFSDDSFTRRIAPAAEVRTIWEEEFHGMRALGGTYILTMHPQFIGRPGRLAMLDAFVAFLRSHDDVAIAPCCEIAARCAASLERT